jgi:methyl coenzyme M reductase subunit D
MLPPFIIDQIRRREEEERRRIQYEQPRLELPVDGHRPRVEVEDEEEAEERAERGVIILDLA